MFNGKFFYVFEDGVIRSVDVTEMEANFKNRSLFRSSLAIAGDTVNVSTVFLGIDHCWSDGDPILFETMILGGEYDESQWRYLTFEEARQNHFWIVACLECGRNPQEPEEDNE